MPLPFWVIPPVPETTPLIVNDWPNQFAVVPSTVTLGPVSPSAKTYPAVASAPDQAELPASREPVIVVLPARTTLPVQAFRPQPMTPLKVKLLARVAGAPVARSTPPVTVTSPVPKAELLRVTSPRRWNGRAAGLGVGGAEGA